MLGLPTCRDVARLLSSAQERALSARQRLGLRMHLLICSSCRNYRANLERLGRVLGSRRKDASSARLDPAAKERIRRALREGDNGT